jgi:hypothetical protein
VGTFFDDHVTDRLFQVSTVEISPFLDLELEGLSGDRSNSDSRRLFSGVGEWAHHNHWVVELVLDLDIVPNGSVLLVNLNSSELNDSITLDLLKSLVNVQVLLGEVLPFSTFDLECPSAGLVDAARAVDFEDMVSSSSVDAEVKLTNSVEVVLIDSVSPWTSHALSVWLVTLGLLDSWVLLILSVSVTAAAPTVVLKSEVLVFSTGCSASVLVVAVFLWTEIEVSASIITVAAD